MLDRYSTKETRELWSDQFKYELMAEIEFVVLLVQERAGLIPNGTFQSIRNVIGNSPEINVDKIREYEIITKHETAAVVSYLEGLCGEQGKWIHFGLTSSDILDTCQAVIMKKITELMISKLNVVVSTLKDLSIKYAETIMIGRSHGIHAEPTTFGYILAGYCMEMNRNTIRLNDALNIISVGKISGPVGNYTHTTPEIEIEVLNLFGLKPESVSTQVVSRDRYAEYFALIGLVATSVERLVTEIRHLQRTEVSEVAEGFATGQKGSSAMPHKKNPILSENLTGLARVIRSAITPAYENVVLWHERDMSHSSVERFICPDVTTTMCSMLDRLQTILSNLIVDGDKMKSNLNLSYGTFASQSILLELIKSGLSRQEAYEIVQRNSFEAVSLKKDFKECLLTDSNVVDILTTDQIKNACCLETIKQKNKKLIFDLLD